MTEESLVRERRPRTIAQQEAEVERMRRALAALDDTNKVVQSVHRASVRELSRRLAALELDLSRLVGLRAELRSTDRRPPRDLREQISQANREVSHLRRALDSEQRVISRLETHSNRQIDSRRDLLQREQNILREMRYQENAGFTQTAPTP